MRWWPLSFVLLALSAAGGCSSEEEPAATPSGPPGCKPRTTIFCRCPKTGEPGWQTCQDSGALDDCGPCDGSNLETPIPGGEGGGGGVPAECGNSKVEGAEQCDDGNFDDDDDCLSDCRDAKCGDGITHVGVEDCDDGNDDDSDGCTKQCTIKVAASDKCPGETIDVTADPAGKKISGDFKVFQPNHEGSCGGTGRDAAYAFQAPSDGQVVVFLTVEKDSKVDGVVYVRAATCDDAKKEVACANNGGPGANEATSAFPVSKGATFYVFADSKGDDPGAFSLRIRFTPDLACEGQGQACDASASAMGVCAQGKLVCSPDKKLVCEPAPKLPKDVCGNELDDNCDGVIDDGCPCAHDRCTPGVPLVADCGDPCVAKICAADEFCCKNEWDQQCIDEVASVCGSAACIKGTCAHSLCQPGAKLTSDCDAPGKCVSNICKTDGFCCAKEWDATCVEKLKVVCNLTCD